MKTPLTLFFILFLFVSHSQSKLVWHDNLKEAVKISQKEKKPIMMFFTGSDWCGWCIRLQKEVFFQEDFKKWASENVVLLELDFPRRKALSPELKEQNSKLQRQFAIQGYPTVWFVEPGKDSQNNLKFDRIGRTGYVKGGPGAWISNANALLDSK
ncbi:thioredoxin family protein [Crocinitomicaceae bacterium]|jgi:protein disulfide-isomerase|nr:thioredoxin family protein [Crocinitomicaceae bacterium]MDB4649598.1 thioredoxin family protein [Crocinitomicaceae bacterium]